MQLNIHAVVIAGGKGERLRPLTNNVPKPMVLLKGKPVLAYLVGWLTRQGVNRITICCGHLHQVIVDYFKDGTAFDAKIDYLVESEPLGRGGALRQALAYVKAGSKPVLAMNGDIFTNLDIRSVINQHVNHPSCLATVVSVPMISPFGIVEVTEDGLVHGFRERPYLPVWINAGIYVLNPDIELYLPHRGDHETSTFPQLAKESRLRAFQTAAFWRSIDTIQDLDELRQELESLVHEHF